MKKLENHLMNLYRSYLEDFSLELQDQRIRFTTSTEEDASNELIFDGVKAFFYADPKKPIDIRAEEPTELSSIVFCDKGFGEFAIVKSKDGRLTGEEAFEISVPNFNLCFGDASFFIEAKSITINEQKFSLRQEH